MEQSLFARQPALVTGAASGIGRACALHLAKIGAPVVINHLPHEQDAAAAMVAEIERDNGRAIAVAADVSNEEQVTAMFAKAVAAFGTVYVLVNNAGIQKDAKFAEMSLNDWQRVLDVNLTGQFLCARAAVREFLRRGVQPDISPAAGKIICMSSVHQVIPWAGHANYASTKGGIHMLMETLAQELGSSHIRVNAILPGAIRTPINRPAWDTPEALNDLLRLIPYGRIGEPEDIANAVAWLASDDSDYVNGANLAVDGGMLLYPGFYGHG